MIAFLWAEDKNGLIGKGGSLPWYLPNDLKFFKQMTVNQAIVMGRKTFEGMGKRPLPNRINIILTTDPSYQADGVKVMYSREEVLDFAKEYEKDTLITGGSGVFKHFLKDVDILHRTVIDEEFAGDTYMIPINWDDWILTHVEEGVMDEKNKHPHRFETYHRKNSF
ncbi:dihydrofolate reductase [Desemzia sp. RIT804]|uniref:dihydrofolate reductase n=1 Tax=Desemzia sp. RIT 804 TaxID=2810209 RepID=UPI00194F93F6|nr:dihydrofolate reductase [Desemzia sp. RIT 804]MBM6613749.1 dihydrofolate reductase [Desemzia sp. RIT 804]